MRYYAGKAQTGSETRALELADTGLGRRLGVRLSPGTFNIALMESPVLGDPDFRHGPYACWRCAVSTRSMIERDEEGFQGWVLRVDGERLPDHFVEVISQTHLRTALNMEHWPSFPVELALNCEKRE